MKLEITSDECETVEIMFAIVEAKTGLTTDQKKIRDKFLKE